MERHQPRPWDVVFLRPLRNSPLGEARELHDLGPSAHDFNDLIRIHATKFRKIYTLRQEFSRPLFRKLPL